MVNLRASALIDVPVSSNTEAYTYRPSIASLGTQAKVWEAAEAEACIRHVMGARKWSKSVYPLSVLCIPITSDQCQPLLCPATVDASLHPGSAGRIFAGRGSCR